MQTDSILGYITSINAFGCFKSTAEPLRQVSVHMLMTDEILQHKMYAFLQTKSPACEKLHLLFYGKQTKQTKIKDFLNEEN